MYVQALQPRTISEVIHHTTVAYKIFRPKTVAKDGKANVSSNVKPNGNPNAKNNAKKRGSNGVYRGSNKLSTEELEKYRKENRFFVVGQLVMPIVNAHNVMRERILLR